MKKAFSKSLSWLLSVVMIFGLFAFMPTSSLTVQALIGTKSGFNTNYTIGGDAGQNVANVAYAQIGKKAANLGYNTEWCAMFAHDCAELAGQGSAVPNQPWVPSLPGDLETAGAKKVSAQEARPGDILLIDANYSGDPEHVEIVYKVENGNVYSIGGNTGTYDYTTSSVCSPRIHPSHIFAIYRPKYSTHTHNYTEYVYYWAAHPHYKCYKCSCGDIKENRNETVVLDTCSDCLTEYKAKLQLDRSCYYEGNPVKISWNKINGATHYNLWIYRIKPDGSSELVSRNDVIKTTEFTYSNLSPGKYYTYFQTYNSNYWMHDNSDWFHSPADRVNFEIKTLTYTTIGDKFYANIIRTDGGKYVTNNNRNVEGRSANSSKSQIWYFERHDNWYYIKNCENGQYLDVANAKNEDGINIQTCVFTNSDAQRWYICGKQGAYYLKSKCSSTRVLDLGTTEEGRNIHLWTAVDIPAQKFTIKNVNEVHNYTVTEAKNSTCTQEGYQIYTCSICGNSYKETISKKAHSYTTKIVAPTCTEQGYTLHACSNCGNNYKDTYTNAIGHNYVLNSQKSTTCTASGEKVYKCSKCGSTKTETVNATGHNYTTKLVAPTCTEKGYTLHTCKNCNNSYKDTYTNALGHNYKLTSEKAATCTTDGEKIYTCSRCGDTKTETVKATGHSYTTNVIAPTCTEKGYTLHTFSKCGDSYKDTYTNALGHDYKLTSEKAATCTTDGEKIYTCSRCGDTKTETVKATGHSYTTKVIAPTCAAKGYTLHTCSKCGDSYKDTYTNATGHKYEETIVAPTTTEQGYTLHTCSVCKHSYKDNYTNILLSNNSTLSAETIKLGETITATAKATGGTGEYLYQVVYKQTTQSKWTTAQSYKANATVTFKPANAVTYDVCVKVKDSNNTEVKKFFTVKVTSDELKNVSTISAQTINLGSTATVNAKATGSTGFYTYAVYYKQKAQTKWTTKQDFKANNTIAVKPAKATTYDICVKVKDDKGTIVKKYFTVNVTDFTNTSTLSATEIKLGNTVKVSCSATGSTGYYQYAVYYKKTSDTKWTTKQSYSSNNTVTIKPAKATTYNVCVKVKDNQNNEVKKYFTVTVK